MFDCASRIVGRLQITTDAHKPYLKAVEEAFGTDADYPMLHKVYGYTEARPTMDIGCDMKVVSGDPDPRHVSTSFVERQNFDANGYPSVYSFDQWILQEDREPCGCGFSLIHVLQLLPRPQNSPRYTCYGSWPNKPCMDHRGDGRTKVHPAPLWSNRVN